VVVEVIDSGHGMPPEHIGKVFDPFFTTKEPGQGSGLGLAICHSIVESLGGSIDATSPPGQGATFVVRLRAAC
jgi:signal transduction histidine kinase